MQKRLYTVKTMVKIGIKRYFRDKTALFFSIVFPLIFLFIFGALFGKSNHVTFRVALVNDSQSQFSQTFTDILNKNNIFKIDHTVTSLSGANNKMNRGQLDATIVLPKDFGQVGQQAYPTGQAVIYYNQNNAQSVQALESVMNGLLQGVNDKFVPYTPPFTVTAKSTASKGLTQFDYVFSGMVGFSIIGLGIFGPTNTFPEMKKQGILRRLRSAPITAAEYIIANVLSYVVIGLIAITIMFIVGLTVFHLHMEGNYLTLAAVIALGIITIFGIGMAVGGWARNEQQAAPLSNIVAFPLMFLSGTFFPTFLMPLWLQNIARYLPLTPIIDSIRMIITENKGVLQLGPQLGLIGAWIIVIYAIAFRVFRWE